DLQLIATTGDLSFHTLPRRQLYGQVGIALDALDGGPGHRNFAHEFAFDGQLSAVFLDDRSGDDITVGQHYLVGAEGRQTREETKGCNSVQWGPPVSGSRLPPDGTSCIFARFRTNRDRCVRSSVRREHRVRRLQQAQTRDSRYRTRRSQPLA